MWTVLDKMLPCQFTISDIEKPLFMQKFFKKCLKTEPVLVREWKKKYQASKNKLVDMKLVIFGVVVNRLNQIWQKKKKLVY